MIDLLQAGMCVRLPSGTVLRLLRRERAEWVCEYLDFPQARGEVLFTGAFLRRHGKKV
jgi:hypothetical protein